MHLQCITLYINFSDKIITIHSNLNRQSAIFIANVPCKVYSHKIFMTAGEHYDFGIDLDKFNAIWNLHFESLPIYNLLVRLHAKFYFTIRD